MNEVNDTNDGVLSPTVDLNTIDGPMILTRTIPPDAVNCNSPISLRVARSDGSYSNIVFGVECITAGSYGNALSNVRIHFPIVQAFTPKPFEGIDWREVTDSMRKVFDAIHARAMIGWDHITFESEPPSQFKGRPFKAKQQALENVHRRETGDISTQRRSALRRKRKKK